MSDSLQPQGLYSLLGFSVFEIFQAIIMEWGAIAYSKDLLDPEIETKLSCILEIGRWILYHWHCLGSPICYIIGLYQICFLQVFSPNLQLVFSFS